MNAAEIPPVQPINFVIQATNKVGEALQEIQRQAAQTSANVAEQMQKAFADSGKLGLFDRLQDELKGISKIELPSLGPILNPDGIIRLASALRSTYAEAEKLAEEMGMTGEAVTFVIQRLQELQSVKLDQARQFQILNQELGITDAQFKKIQSSLNGLEESTGKGKGSFGTLFDQVKILTGTGKNSVAAVSFAFNEVTDAIDKLKAAGGEAFDALVGSNERLNAQLLASQSNLASATKIFRNGQEITDPTEKIKLTGAALSAALKQIEKDTQSLVGVTSSQVNELFQITLTNAAELNNQSKEFPGPIEAATSLTKGWAASLQTMQVPLDQARQEINSILKGQIDVNSTVAKNLGITNDQVKNWKSQGKLVDELNKRLETFVAGNAIAARSIAGITSNMQDVVEVFLRELGKPLLEPVISGLEAVYNLMSRSKDAALDFAELITNRILDGFENIGNGLKALLPAFSQIGQALVKFSGVGIDALAAAFNQIGTAVGQVLTAMAPLASLFTSVTEAIGQVAMQAFITALQTAVPVIQTLGSVMSALLSVINPVASALKPVVDRFISFANSNIGKIAIQIGLITLALNAMLPILVGSLIPALTTLVSTTIPGLLATTGQLALTAIPALVASLAQIPPIISGLVASGIPGLVAGLGGLGTAFVGATAAAAPLAAVLGVIAAAGAITFAVKGTQDLKVAEEAIENLAKSTNFLADESLKYASQLKVLQDIEAQGGKLTDEQRKKREALIMLGQEASKSINQQIAAIKEQINQTTDPNQINALKVQVELLERRKQLLSGGGIQIEGKGTTDQGSEINQLSEKLKGLRDQLEKPVDDTALASATKTALDTTKRAFELGIITKKEALETLNLAAKAKGQTAEGQAQAISAIEAINKESLDRQLEDQKVAQAQVEAQVQLGIISEEEGAKQVTALKKEQLDLQLKNLQENKEAADKLRKDQLDADLKAIDLQIDNLKPKASRGDQSAIEEIDRLNKKKVQLQESFQEAQTEADRKFNNQKTQNQIDQQKNEIEGFRKVQAARKAEVEDEVKDRDAAISEIEARVESGQLNELEGIKQVTNEKREQLRVQLEDVKKQIEEEKALIAQGKGSKEKLEDLEREQRGLQVKRTQLEVDAQRKIQQAKLAEIDRAEKKATDALLQAEADRKVKLDVAFKQGRISRDAIREQERAASIGNIQKELEIEKQKLAALSKVPRSGKPEDVERVEGQIRASRRKTSELYLKLLEEETRIQKDRIDEQFNKLKNSLTAQQQELQKQVTAYDGITKALELQKTLTEARLTLLRAISDYTQGEYDLAQKLLQTEDDRQDRAERRQELENQLATATDEKSAREAQRGLERLNVEDQIKQIQLEAAQAKFESLIKEQELERESLELEQKKTAALLEQEKIKLRQQAIQAKADEAQARADLAKLAIDKTATPEAVEAAKLNLEAKTEQRSAIADQQQLINQQAGIQDAQFASERQQLAKKQDLARDQQQAEIATLTPGIEDDRALAQETLKKARSPKPEAQAIDQSFKQDTQQAASLEQEFSQRLDDLKTKAQPAEPIAQQEAAISIAKEGNGILGEIRDYLKQFSEQQPESSKTPANLNARINNYFTGSVDSKDVQNSSQTVLRELKTVLNLAGQRG